MDPKEAAEGLSEEQAVADLKFFTMGGRLKREYPEVFARNDTLEILVLIKSQPEVAEAAAGVAEAADFKPQ